MVLGQSLCRSLCGGVKVSHNSLDLIDRSKLVVKGRLEGAHIAAINERLEDVLDSSARIAPSVTVLRKHLVCLFSDGSKILVSVRVIGCLVIEEWCIRGLIVFPLI